MPAEALGAHVTPERAAALRAALGGGAVFGLLGLVLVAVLATLLVPDFRALRGDEDLPSYQRRTDVALLLAGVLAAVPAGAVARLLAAPASARLRALLAVAAPLVLGGLYLLTSDVSNTARLAALVLLPAAALAGHTLAGRLAEPSTRPEGPSPAA